MKRKIKIKRIDEISHFARIRIIMKSDETEGFI